MKVADIFDANNKNEKVLPVNVINLLIKINIIYFFVGFLYV